MKFTEVTFLPLPINVEVMSILNSPKGLFYPPNSAVYPTKGTLTSVLFSDKLL